MATQPRRRLARRQRHVGTRWRRRSAGSNCAGCARRAIADLARHVGAELVMERYYNFGGEGMLAARAAGHSRRARSQRADRRLSRLDEIPARSGACSSNRCGAGGIASCRHDRPVRDADRGHPAVLGRPRDACSRSSGAPTSITSGPTSGGPLPFTRRSASHLLRVRRGVPIVARRRATRGHARSPARAGRPSLRRGVHRRRSGAGRRRARRRELSRASSSPAPCRTPTLPAALAAADIGVAPFDPTRHGPLRLGFYWSPLKIFEYMAVGLPVVAPALPRLERLVEHGREGLLYDAEDPRALDRALVIAGRRRSAAQHGRGRPRSGRHATSAGRRIAACSTPACVRW